MRIVKYDERRGAMRIRVESVDDLWVLKNVIREGDVVVARTLRDVKIDGEGKRRRPMTLAVRVKNVYFQPFASRLRVHGVIVEGPEGYGLRGSHHTLNIDVGTEFELIKERWLESQVRRIRRAASRWVKAVLAAADFDEVSVAVMYRQGLKYLYDSSLPGVSEEDPKSIGRVADSIAKLIAEAVERERSEVVVIGSPAVLREEVGRRVKEMLRGVRVYLDSVSHGGRAGIHELVRRDSVKRLLAEAAAVDAEETLSDFLKLLSMKPDMVSAGIEEVRLAVSANAVKKLLVLEELLSGDRAEEVEELLSEAERKGAKVRVVPSSSPAAAKLRAFGGIIALHRFRFDTTSIKEGGG